MREASRQTYRFGQFRLETKTRTLHDGDALVSLTPKAFDTLIALVERAGEVVSKRELLDEVWPDTWVEEATLTQNVYTLRKVLGEHDDGTNYIATVPRLGYRFVVPVERVARATPPVGTRPGTIRSVAVLPFLHLGEAGPAGQKTTGGVDQSYLGIGMADALITRLSGVRKLVVRPTSAVLRYADQERDPLEAGRELGVDAVFAGTIMRSGRQIRVGVQLVGLATASPIWAESFDGDVDDIFPLEDSISSRAAKALALVLSRRERSRLSTAAVANRPAYEAYLKGRFFWNRRTEDGLRTALRCFHEAIEHDPHAARAWAGVAEANVLLPLYGDTPPAEVFPRAIEAAERALALDEELAEAHTSLAYTRFVYEWNWLAAERGLERAVELDPGYPTAYQWYAFLLAALGRHDEALDRAERAVELDPLSLVIRCDRGLVFCFARRFEEAIAGFEEALELDTRFPYAHFGLALAYGDVGRHADAVAAAVRARELSGETNAMRAVHGYALARAGEREAARRVLAELEQARAARHVQASRFALIYAGLDETEVALDHLALACDERSRFVVFLRTWSIYDGLRGSSRFDELLRRLGLGPRDAVGGE